MVSFSSSILKTTTVNLNGLNGLKNVLVIH